MFEELLGPGEEEEEEVTGDPSTQAGDPPRAGRDPVWPREGAGCLSSSRTLSHPSCQPFYSAPLGSSRHPPLEDPAGPPPFLDCSSFFYTDPIQPPGYRIYNWLSSCSLDVLHRLHPETQPPSWPPGRPACSGHRQQEETLVLRSGASGRLCLMELPEAVAPTGRQAGSEAEQGDP
ncbi:histone deacetylase complex subunit SAP25 [Erythrolamprus reginae]|uniref:histone deacetylase complex subunit SAP25 n=1 Tax=Erythrolamprus reginae TaxID=121349 RepID=UPI00396CB497